ncbi:MAG: PQQ-dependent sugar dehydrogenase [Planctomycetota bacterium]|nr:PQQ-dependent sugar dehydrogenase [Planctomycetota bacterium]
MKYSPTSFHGVLLILLVALAPSPLLGAEEPGMPPAGDEAPSAEFPRINLERAWPQVVTRRPVQLVARPDRSDILYVVEQFGRIRTVDGSDLQSSDSTQVLDITDRVNARSNEEGLLALAFHPEFERNNELYLYYTAVRPRRAVLSRFSMDEDRALILPESEEVILEVKEPYWNHNGGDIVFGPDGMLYLSIGDGGSANDPHGYGQDLSTLLAKIIRIDVSRKEADRAYSIPPDNPFVEREDARDEIWAYGLRNVWRMSFDRATGDLWAGDVGQNMWEEIDLIVRGGNYGWNLREGAHDFRRPRRAWPGRERVDDVEEVGDGGLIDPVAEYDHRAGLSVTGGFVYRGSEYPALVGVYLYADYAFGTVWGIRKDGEVVSDSQVLLKKPGSLLSSFGQANDGTLFVTSFEQSEQGPGALWKVVVPEQ